MPPLVDVVPRLELQPANRIPAGQFINGRAVLVKGVPFPETYITVALDQHLCIKGDVEVVAARMMTFTEHCCREDHEPGWIRHVEHARHSLEHGELFDRTQEDDEQGPDYLGVVNFGALGDLGEVQRHGEDELVGELVDQMDK